MKNLVGICRFITILLFSINILHSSNALAHEQELEGYQVKFDYEKYPEEREVAYLSFKENYTFNQWHPLEKSNIGIDIFDIDDDGEKEIFTYLQNGGYCGSAGCTLEIFKLDKISGKYKRIHWTGVDGIESSLNVREDIKILKNKTLGYHDIAFYGRADKPAIWQWNGTSYK